VFHVEVFPPLNVLPLPPLIKAVEPPLPTALAPITTQFESPAADAIDCAPTNVFETPVVVAAPEP